MWEVSVLFLSQWWVSMSVMVFSIIDGCHYVVCVRARVRASRIKSFFVPVSHVIILGTPAPVHVGIAVDLLKVLHPHVEYTSNQHVVG